MEAPTCSKLGPLRLELKPPWTLLICFAGADANLPREDGVGALPPTQSFARGEQRFVEEDGGAQVVTL